ncbi:MAG: hypothetical protein M1836_000637 [Candelina mexicana]|nr:MAG: hypothetical protein M1836_000637 [Candelina mexicana]
MASPDGRSLSPTSLKQRLAAALPKGAQFTLYHVSCPPTRCPAIFSAPPDSKPERTYCESHLCSFAIETSKESRRVLVFAIEVLIYSTANLTTLFVSKADSTGYLHFLELPKGTTSPLKTISTTIISYLAETRQRPSIRLVVSLFARAQDQYLFPGSIENHGKHVLSDRRLVKWWCEVLDPVVRENTAESHNGNTPVSRAEAAGAKTAQAYLIVPGFDKYETISFFPSSVKAEKPGEKRWISSHPLRDISNHPNAPPRCLIPHFPDDPKARFLVELDDEIPEGPASQTSDSPSKRGNSGQWRSVRTLEQFWETMAFRQECSSGRLVGFIWVVFTPEPLSAKSLDVRSESSQISAISISPTDDGDGRVLPTPTASQPAPTLPQTPPKPQRSASTIVIPISPGVSSPNSRRRTTELPSSQSSLASQKSSSSTKSRKLKGPIIPRQPRIKSAKSSKRHTQPMYTRYYLWPSQSRGQVVLDEIDYKRVNDLLLGLDFSEQEVAHNSTRRWLDEVGVAARVIQPWGEIIIGEKELAQTEKHVPSATNLLNMGLIKRKRKSITEDKGVIAQKPDDAGSMLASTSIRKKPKSKRHRDQMTTQAT